MDLLERIHMIDLVQWVEDLQSCLDSTRTLLGQLPRPLPSIPSSISLHSTILRALCPKIPILCSAPKPSLVLSMHPSQVYSGEDPEPDKDTRYCLPHSLAIAA